MPGFQDVVAAILNSTGPERTAWLRRNVDEPLSENLSYALGPQGYGFLTDVLNAGRLSDYQDYVDAYKISGDLMNSIGRGDKWDALKNGIYLAGMTAAVATPLLNARMAQPWEATRKSLSPKLQRQGADVQRRVIREATERTGKSPTDDIVDAMLNRAKRLTIDERGLFTGEHSHLKNKDALRIAKRMESEGRGPGEILDQTGWFRHPVDGGWRYEISDRPMMTRALADSGNAVDNLRASPDPYAPMGSPEEIAGLTRRGSYFDVVSHPKLKEAYPELDEITVSTERGFNDPNLRGQFNRKRQTLNVNRELDPLAQKTAILHETNHGIEDIEGWGTGGSPPPAGYLRDRVFGGASNEIMKVIGPDDAEQEAFRLHVRDMIAYDDLEQQARALANAGEGAADPKYVELLRERQTQLQNRLSAYARHIMSSPKADRLAPLFADLESAIRGGDDYWNEQAFNIYQSSVGETEARNVGRRMWMTTQDIKNTPPAKTQDFPYEEQHILNRGEGTLLKRAKKKAFPEAENAPIPGAAASSSIGGPEGLFDADLPPSRQEADILRRAAKEAQERARKVVPPSGPDDVYNIARNFLNRKKVRLGFNVNEEVSRQMKEAGMFARAANRAARQRGEAVAEQQGPGLGMDELAREITRRRLRLRPLM